MLNIALFFYYVLFDIQCLLVIVVTIAISIMVGFGIPVKSTFFVVLPGLPGLKTVQG